MARPRRVCAFARVADLDRSIVTHHCIPIRLMQGKTIASTQSNPGSPRYDREEDISFDRVLPTRVVSARPRALPPRAAIPTLAKTEENYSFHLFTAIHVDRTTPESSRLDRDLLTASSPRPRSGVVSLEEIRSHRRGWVSCAASDARVECEKIFYEIRTWTLVALKAATRPTKEEARRADISIV